MADIQFVNGIRASRKEDAPDWAVLKQTIDRDRLIPWLQEQPENLIYIETLLSKAGNYYAKIDDNEREYQTRKREEELQKAKDAVATPMQQPQQAVEIPEDDIPF